MKKLIVLLALVFVLCVPELSIAEKQEAPGEAQLAVTTSEIYQTMDKLEEIIDDLNRLCAEKEATRPMVLLFCANYMLELAKCNYSYVAAMLFHNADIQADKRVRWKMAVLELLRNSKTNLSAGVATLQWLYSEVKDPPALLLIDKAKDLIRSSLPLFDQAIQILEPNKPASP